MLRRLKYTMIADALDAAVRHTPLFASADGPPDVINFAGGGDFRTIGDNTIALVRREAGLEPGEAVLDIGCAIGRNALALHRAMGEQVDYAGFDIVRYGISWCRRWAGRHAPSWRFDHADIANSFYNPRGRLDADTYRFPYEDESFDLSIATSVYTHMMPEAVARYLRESARVTRPGGRLYATAFLRDEAARNAIASGEAAFTFAHEKEGAHVQSAAEPELAVAHDRALFTETLTAAGARQVEIRPGSWRGGEGVDFQDIVLARF